MRHSESCQKVAGAFVAAQAEFRSAKMTATNPHFKSKYAPLPEVMDAVRAGLEKRGLAVLQAVTAFDATGFTLTTTLLHDSGEWLAGDVRMPVTGTAQQVGGALTYARRYGLSALCGIVADEDDDGNAATAPAKRAVPRPTAKVPPAAANVLVMPMGKSKGKPLTAVVTPDLTAALQWAREHGKFEEFQEAAALELDQRQSGEDGAMGPGPFDGEG